MILKSQQNRIELVTQPDRHQVTDNLWEITKAMEVLRQDNWTAEVTSELRNFEKSLIVALKEKGWDGKESLDTVTWSFTGGLFYSITGMCGLNHDPPHFWNSANKCTLNKRTIKVCVNCS